MADFNLRVGDLFRPGADVDVFPAANWNPALPPDGEPQGASQGDGARVGDGESLLKLSGLDADTEYYAHTVIDGRHQYVRFRTKAE